MQGIKHVKRNPTPKEPRLDRTYTRYILPEINSVINAENFILNSAALES
jgi:hypothetical protein